MDYKLKVTKLMDSNKMIGTVIGIVVSLIVIATILPEGIEALTNSTGTWGNATVETLAVTLLPILVIVGIIMLFVSRRKN